MPTVPSGPGRSSCSVPERVSCRRIAGTPPHSTERYRLRPMQAATALNILLVDDDEALRENLKRSFEREGHRITAVPDGHAALERAGAEQYDIVLLDVALGPPPPPPPAPRRRPATTSPASSAPGARSSRSSC